METDMRKLTFAALYKDSESSIAFDELAVFTYPWETLDHIGEIILRIGQMLPDDLYEKRGDVWIARSASVASSAELRGPCIVCENAEIRQCAFVRGNVIVGKNCVVGNSVELKNCVLFNNAQIPHFNYVGDSIVGYHAHMGAGAVTSNVKSDQTPVKIRIGQDSFNTGRRKCGAFLGDYAEIGCNSVLNPGTVIGRNTNVYPLSCVRGYVPSDSIYKNPQNIVKKN